MTRLLPALGMLGFPAFALAWVELPRLLANLRDRAEFRVIDERERVNRALAKSRTYTFTGRVG